MRCLIVDDDREFSYKLSVYIDNFLKGIFKSYQIVEINEKFDDFSQYQDIHLLFIDIDLKDLKLTLDGYTDMYVNISFGDNAAVVITKENAKTSIKNVIPQIRI